MFVVCFYVCFRNVGSHIYIYIIYISKHEIVQPLTTPTPYWLWKMYIILAMEPQPTTSEQSTLNSHW